MGKAKADLRINRHDLLFCSVSFFSLFVSSLSLLPSPVFFLYFGLVTSLLGSLQSMILRTIFSIIRYYFITFINAWFSFIMCSFDQLLDQLKVYLSR